MRAVISVVLLGGGCSLIYNPSNLPEAPTEAGIPIDATVDATVVFDADPNFLALTGVAPALVYEGEGDEGSRPAMVVVTGTQMVPGVKMTITDHSTGAAPPGMVIDDAHMVLSDDGKQLAVPVKFPVEAALKVNTKRQLDVTVTQMANGMPKSATLSVDDNMLPLFQEQGLAELEDTSTEFDTNHNLPSGLHTYSHVKLTKTFSYKDTDKPMQIRAVAGIDIENTTKVVLGFGASGQNPGPGGNKGGAGGAGGVLGGAGNGIAGSGHGGGQANGGGGSFATKGDPGNGAPGTTTNDPALIDISSSGTPDSGSGGAGAIGGSVLGATGGVGGGGGGTIEFTAGGNLTIQDLNATGGQGASGGGNTAGGSGSGGAILLRTGGTLMTGTLSAAGGPTGGTGSGKGGDGWIRIDAPTDSGNASAYAGPMLVGKPLATSDVMITRSAKPTLAVHGQPSTTIGIYFKSADGTKVSALQSYTIGNTGTGAVALTSPLNRGYNSLCLVPAKADASSPAEAQNCYDLVYLFAL